MPGASKRGIAVDASALGNPGPVEYQGIDLSTGKQLFHIGPLSDGTNNAGEFLAVVHALAWCKQNGLRTTIYSDSQVAICWAYKRRHKSLMIPTNNNVKIRDLMTRAEKWLKKNGFAGCRLEKWNTRVHGEIPADFGRKIPKNTPL